MLTFFRDIRYAARQLRQSPGFSLTVVLALALGIGATTAIFSLVEAVLLRPLPFADPERLVMLGEHIGAGPHTAVTSRDILTYTRATSAFSSLGGFATFTYELSGNDTPEQIDVGRFNASVFTTLGVQPELGRVFTPQEEDAHQLLAVISYRLWQNRFHRDPRILGSSIVLDRKTYTITGVMPRSNPPRRRTLRKSPSNRHEPSRAQRPPRPPDRPSSARADPARPAPDAEAAQGQHAEPAARRLERRGADRAVAVLPAGLARSPLVTGLAIAPQGVVGFAAGAFGARLTGRVGIRRVLVLTSAAATIGFLVLSRLPASGGYSPLFAAVMLVGFGTAGTAFGTMVTASHGVADGDQGLVGGVVNTSRQIGAAIGAALLPAVADAVDHGNRAAAGGDRAAMLAGAVAAALALAVALGSATRTRPRLRHL